MEVVFSANSSWYLYNFRRNTLESFLALGHRVHIIAKKDLYSDKLVQMGCLFHRLSIQSNSLNPIYDTVTLLHLSYLYLKIRPDYIYNFTPKINIYGSLSALLFRKAKVINNIAGLGTAFIEDGFKKQLVKLLYKLSQGRADLIFFQNEEDLSLFVINNLVKKEKCIRIPGSGVDLKKFKVSKEADDEYIKFLLVARLIEQKGIRLYVEAARKIKEKNPHIKFSLLGPIVKNNKFAISEEEIEEWVASDVIEYLGESDDVPSIMQQYDCIVLPSYYREGVPKSLLEAAASGKIIITTNHVGCRETVSHGVNGFLCEPKSVMSLAMSITSVLSLTSLERSEMKKNSRILAEEKFDETIVINKYLETLSNEDFSCNS